MIFSLEFHYFDTVSSVFSGVTPFWLHGYEEFVNNEVTKAGISLLFYLLSTYMLWKYLYRDVLLLYFALTVYFFE